MDPFLAIDEELEGFKSSFDVLEPLRALEAEISGSLPLPHEFVPGRDCEIVSAKCRIMQLAAHMAREVCLPRTTAQEAANGVEARKSADSVDIAVWRAESVSAKLEIVEAVVDASEHHARAGISKHAEPRRRPWRAVGALRKPKEYFLEVIYNGNEGHVFGLIASIARR